jgi:ABC-type cobalamin/Fe3+-siderophores transport system ATPase subunit
MVTHDSNLARRVARTVLLVDGEVVAEDAEARSSLAADVLLDPVHSNPSRASALR